MSKVLLIFFLFLFCSDVLSCPIGLSDSSPGISCSYIYGACGLTDQLLWVLPVTSSIPYQAWCASDGWALAMKIDGNSPLFGYNSGYWVNNSLYNSDPYLLSSVSQAKLQPFIDTPGDSIRLVMVTPNGNTGSPLLLSVSFSSLQALFSGGTVLTNAALSSWYNIIPGGAARQPNCNYQGINIATGRIHQSSTAYARLAIMFNNENECISIVSFLGIGLLDGLPSGSYNYNSPLTGKSIYAGSVYACCGECGVDYCSVATITYVYVRGPTPTPTVTATASVTSKPTASSSATGLPPISGRVVELSSTACSSLLSVQEIVIVTADTSAGYNSRNLARSAVMSASSFFTATPPSLANDGIVDQGYPTNLAQGNFWSSSQLCSLGSPQWLRFTLPWYAAIVRIDIYNRGLSFCGNCDMTQLLGASIKIWARSPGEDSVPVWNGTIANASSLVVFRPGLAANDSMSYSWSDNTTSTLEILPPPYATPSVTNSATSTSFKSFSSTISSTRTSSVTPGKTKSLSSTASSTRTSTSTPSVTTGSPTISVSSTRSPTATASGLFVPCPGAWTRPPGSDTCYRHFSDNLNFNDAALACSATAAVYGSTGTLASVRNQAEASFVIDGRCGALPDSEFSIGLFVSPLSLHDRCCFEWMSGANASWISTTGQTYWNDGEPNNGDNNEKCVHVLPNIRKLNDLSCSGSLLPYCCEMTALIPSPVPTASKTSTATGTPSSTVTGTPSNTMTSTPTSSKTRTRSSTATGTASRTPSSAGTVSGTGTSTGKASTRTSTRTALITRTNTWPEIKTRTNTRWSKSRRPTSTRTRKAK